MKVSIIPVFIPHIGCPHRCVFCNQWQITGHHGVPSSQTITDMVRQYTVSGGRNRHWEVAFYGGSFTAIPEWLQEQLLQPAYEALQAGYIDSIRCSTRPDCISISVLKRLRAYGLSTVELGVQSMDDFVLRQAKRGHTAQDVVTATEMLRDKGFIVGHQLMPGLPGEDWHSLIETVRAIIALHPDLTRIYPVAVLENTELADMYRQGNYKPLSIHEGVCRAAYMKQHFLCEGIPCIRTGLQATKELNDDTLVIAGAYTPAMGEMVDTKRYQHFLFQVIEALPMQDIRIQYSRKDTSRIRGIRNVTVRRARLRFSQKIEWQENNRLAAGVIAIMMQDEKKYMLYMDAERVEEG